MIFNSQLQLEEKTRFSSTRTNILYTPIKLLFPLFFMQQAIQDDNAGGTTSTGDLGITLKSSKLFFHHLTNLRPTMTPIKELKGPVGQLKVIFSCSATPNSKCRNK